MPYVLSVGCTKLLRGGRYDIGATPLAIDANSYYTLGFCCFDEKVGDGKFKKAIKSTLGGQISKYKLNV